MSHFFKIGIKYEYKAELSVNFKNVKIYFLIILAAANIFLLVNYFAAGVQNDKLDANAISDTVSVLMKNMIGINTDTVPDEYQSGEIIECTFDSGYYERIAALIGGSERESVNILPDNSIRVTLTDGDCFILDSSFRIDYTAAGNEYTGLAEIRDIFSENGLKTDVLKEAGLSEGLKKAAKGLLVPENQRDTAPFFSYKTVGAYSYKDSTVAVFTQTLNGKEIRDHVMYVEFADGKAVRAVGKWFYPESALTYSSEVYDQLSVLFKELEYKNNVYGTADLNIFTLDSARLCYSITDMDTAYCVYWKTGQDGVFFIPAWKISTDEPGIRYYNAVSCELYE